MIDLALGLELEIAVDGAPHVFLIPQPLEPHGGNLRRMLCDQLIERLSLPERIVTGMLHHSYIPGQLLEAVLARVIARRTGAAKLFIIVVGIALDRLIPA